MLRKRMFIKGITCCVPAQHNPDCRGDPRIGKTKAQTIKTKYQRIDQAGIRIVIMHQQSLKLSFKLTSNKKRNTHLNSPTVLNDFFVGMKGPTAT